MSEAEKSKAQLVIVTGPVSYTHLDVYKRQGYTKPIEDFFINQKIPVVRLSDHLGSVPPKERIVGKNDGHASAKVNALIADLLYKQIHASTP